MPPPDLRRSSRTGTDQPARDEWAARLRGFGPAGLLAMAVVPFAGTALIGAILVLLWARLTRTPWRDLGYVPPRSWTRDIAVGILFGGVFKFVMKALVMPL